MIDASNLSKLGQALLSLGIRVAVIAAVAVVNYLIAGLSNGTITLPDPALTVPALGLVLSEADSWLVTWEKANGLSSGQPSSQQ
jgi:hypothetical protein